MRTQYIVGSALLAAIAAVVFTWSIRGAKAPASGEAPGSSAHSSGISATAVGNTAPRGRSAGLVGEWEYAGGELKMTCNGTVKTVPLKGRRFTVESSGADYRYADDTCTYSLQGDSNRLEVSDVRCTPKRGQANEMTIVKHTIMSTDGKMGRVSMSAESNVSLPRDAGSMKCLVSGEADVKKVSS